VSAAYVATMKEKFPALKPIKLVVDAGNGSGGPLGIRTMRALGLDPEELYCDMDGTFPHHHPDPTVPKNVEALIDRVRKSGARRGASRTTATPTAWARSTRTGTSSGATS